MKQSPTMQQIDNLYYVVEHYYEESKITEEQYNCLCDFIEPLVTKLEKIEAILDIYK